MIQSNVQSKQSKAGLQLQPMEGDILHQTPVDDLKRIIIVQKEGEDLMSVLSREGSRWRNSDTKEPHIKDIVSISSRLIHKCSKVRMDLSASLTLEG